MRTGRENSIGKNGQSLFFTREFSRNVLIKTKHHDMRSQKALVFISGQVIFIFNSFSLLGWQYHSKLEIMTFPLCLRMVLAVCGHLLRYSTVLNSESIANFMILTMIVKIVRIFRTFGFHIICMLLGKSLSIILRLVKLIVQLPIILPVISVTPILNYFLTNGLLIKEILWVSYYFPTICVQNL